MTNPNGLRPESSETDPLGSPTPISYGRTDGRTDEEGGHQLNHPHVGQRAGEPENLEAIEVEKYCRPCGSSHALSINCEDARKAHTSAFAQTARDALAEVRARLCPCGCGVPPYAHRDFKPEPETNESETS